MKGLAALLLSIFVAMICWGIYGPVLAVGRSGMQGSSLKPFICVGIAYFLIAVLAPIVTLRMKGESGNWTTTGIVWSLAAGAVGALGALGIILALAFHGSPVYVMPLVFGGAPVINVLVTMAVHPPKTPPNPMLYVGFLLAVAGAGMVLYFKPS